MSTARSDEVMTMRLFAGYWHHIPMANAVGLWFLSNGSPIRFVSDAIAASWTVDWYSPRIVITSELDKVLYELAKLENMKNKKKFGL